MASIDKIYGNLSQQKQFSKWLTQHNPLIMKYLYTWDGEWLTDGETHPISNFPCEIDDWLKINCDIPFIIEELKIQYSDFKG